MLWTLFKIFYYIRVAYIYTYAFRPIKMCCIEMYFSI